MSEVPLYGPDSFLYDRRHGQHPPEQIWGRPKCTCVALGYRETGIVLSNNQRQHRTSRAPQDVLPLLLCANYCTLCQPLVRAFSGWIRSPPPSLECTSPCSKCIFKATDAFCSANCVAHDRRYGLHMPRGRAQVHCSGERSPAKFVFGVRCSIRTYLCT